MKKIAIIIIIISLGIGYFLPINIIRTSIDKTINFLIDEIYSIDWLFSEKNCTDIANMEKDFCGREAK